MALEMVIFIFEGLLLISSAYSNFTNKILYGEDVQTVQPFMASLLVDNGFWFFHLYELICGGTVFSLRYVVTAAHCLTGGINDQPTVVGINGLSIRDMGAYHDIVKKIIHPDYVEWDYKRNNIALVKTKNDMSNFVAPSPNPENWEAPIILYGWGVTASGSTPDSLKQLRLEIVSDIWPCDSEPAAREGMFSCFIAFDDRDRSRYGDSGGPVILKSTTPSERDVIIGVHLGSGGPVDYNGRRVFSMQATNYSHFYPWLIEAWTHNL